MIKHEERTLKTELWPRQDAFASHRKTLYNQFTHHVITDFSVLLTQPPPFYGHYTGQPALAGRYS